MMLQATQYTLPGHRNIWRGALTPDSPLPQQVDECLKWSLFLNLKKYYIWSFPLINSCESLSSVYGQEINPFF